MVISVFVGAWVARHLGNQAYGQLNIAQAYLILLMPVLKFGLDQVIIQRIVDEPDKKYTILGTALTIRLCVAIIILPTVLFLIFWLNPNDTTVNILTTLLAVGTFLQSFEVIDFYFQAKIASRDVVIARNLAYGLTSALKVIAILSNANVLIFGLLISIDFLFYTIGLLIAYYRSGESIFRWQFRLDTALSLIRTSYPLIIAGLAVSAYMRIDQIMLANMISGDAGEAAVGTYAAAVRIAEMWYFVPTAIVSSVFPVILKTRSQNYELYLSRVQRLFNLLVLVSYCFAIFITIFSSQIIQILYGADYLEAAGLLNILVWSGIWVSLGVARTTILHAEDRRAFSMWSTGLGAIINIALNWLLIPSMGAMGCALATLLAQVIAAHISTYLYRPIRIFGDLQTRAIIFPNPFVKE